MFWYGYNTVEHLREWEITIHSSWDVVYCHSRQKGLVSKWLGVDLWVHIKRNWERSGYVHLAHLFPKPLHSDHISLLTTMQSIKATARLTQKMSFMWSLKWCCCKIICAAHLMFSSFSIFQILHNPPLGKGENLESISIKFIV